MARSSTTSGLIIAVLAAATFGTSGALVKPMLEAGWSPAGAVTARVLIGGIVLLPLALFSVRGKWDAVWRGRWRILGLAAIGVAGTQLVYFAAIQRIPVGTGILIEYMAPLLLVAVAWVLTRKTPKAVVLVGSVIALVGLVMVVSPGGGDKLDTLGLIFALMAMIGCAGYYVISARPSDGLPPVAFAAFGLIIGGILLGIVGVSGLVPFTMSTDNVVMFGETVTWWLPLLILGVVGTACAYAASITASEMLGSRLASFAGLLEVVFGTLYAWLLLGENFGLLQLLGGALILAGIIFVRSEKVDVAPEASAEQLAPTPSQPTPAQRHPQEPPTRTAALTVEIAIAGGVSPEEAPRP
ncbi:MAG: putative rane protein [Glaciihabitans sp.]|nr:putative rane protein [Glaciihabitans sp.]